MPENRGWFEIWRERLIWRVCLAFATGALTLALVVMAAQVVSRYLLGQSLVWAEELARYSLIWSAMVASAVAYREGQHIGVTYLLERVPRAAGILMSLFIHLSVLSFALLISWQGWFLAMRNFDRNQLSPAMQIPISWAYLAIPVGGLLMALAAVEALLQGRLAAPGSETPGRD